MKYKADYAPRAAEQLRGMDPRVGWKVLDAVDVLCDDPVRRSRRSQAPHPRHLQVFLARIEDRGRAWHLAVYFAYAADEQTLIIAEFVLYET